MSDRALITIAIGGDYLSNWRKYCAANWSSYAARHGLDVVVITERFHDSARSPAWQKCLVPASEQARKYRHIALLDADIVINPEAPNILEQTPEHLVGGILCGSHIHPDLQHVLLSRKFRQPIPYEHAKEAIDRHNAESYRIAGLPHHSEGIIQTGVLVLSPEAHWPLFRQAFEHAGEEQRSFEQIPLSHALLSAGVFHQIDTRFNSVVAETLWVHHNYLFTVDFGGEHVTRAVIRAEFANNFFLHFAYHQWLIKYLLD